MESRRYNFECAGGDEHRDLEKLIAKAEQRYTEVGSQLAKHFVTHFAKTKHPIVGLHHGVPKKSELTITNFGITICFVWYYSKVHEHENNLAKAVGKPGR